MYSHTPEQIKEMKETAARKAEQTVWPKIKFLGGTVFFIAAVVFLCVLLGPQKITTEQLAFWFGALFVSLVVGMFFFLRQG